MSIPKKCDLNFFIDSDGVVADFVTTKLKLGMTSEQFKHEPGAYTYLGFMPGAEDALTRLKMYDDANIARVWIATKTPAGAPYAYSEKALWYRWNAPWLEDRVILIHDKSLLGTENDVLVDDRAHKGGCEHFRGTFINFGSDQYPNWSVVLQKLEDIIIQRQQAKDQP
jgi:5'(3')-deoxyribonucleotidase